MLKSKFIGSVSLQLFIMKGDRYVDLAKLPANCHGFIFKESVKPLYKKQKCCQLISALEKYIEGQSF